MKWEYRFTNYDDTDAAEMNALGREGWELVQVVTDPFEAGGEHYAPTAIFKRQISN